MKRNKNEGTLADDQKDENPCQGSNSFAQESTRPPWNESLARTGWIFDRTWVSDSPFWCRKEFSFREKEKLREVFGHCSLCGGAPFRFLVERVRESFFG